MATASATAKIKAWLKTDSAVNRRNFDQECVALVYQVLAKFGHVSGTYPDADAAFEASAIVSQNMGVAPAGAIGHFRGGAHGDIALSLGGGEWLHASSHITAAADWNAWGPLDRSHVGALKASEYEALSGYSARGWSHEFGKMGSVTFAADVSPAAKEAKATADFEKAKAVFEAKKTAFEAKKAAAVASSTATGAGAGSLADPAPAGPVTVQTVDPVTPIANTPAELAALAGSIPDLSAETTPLAGLLAEHVKARKRAYAGYALAALGISCIPDVVLSGLLVGNAPHTLTIVGVLSTSILLKVGTAFGFVAASNAK